MGSTLRDLARLAPGTLALMHGPAFSGDALNALAAEYERRGVDALSALDERAARALVA